MCSRITFDIYPFLPTYPKIFVARADSISCNLYKNVLGNGLEHLALNQNGTWKLTRQNYTERRWAYSTSRQLPRHLLPRGMSYIVPRRVEIDRAVTGTAASAIVPGSHSRRRRPQLNHFRHNDHPNDPSDPRLLVAPSEAEQDRAPG